MSRLFRRLFACLLATAATTGAAHAQTGATPAQPSLNKPTVSDLSQQAPAVQPVQSARSTGSPVSPPDPYPLPYAGWSPPEGPVFFFSRWEEDWTKLKDAGKAPPLKAMPIFGDVTLTLSGMLRVRVDAYNDAVLIKRDDFHQTTFRSMAGADLRIGSHFRVYGELADGQVTGFGRPYAPNFRGTAIPANEHNDLAVLQLFGEASATVDNVLIGARVGRMEFIDGPRQVIGGSDGVNIRREWNGGRFYLHTGRFRVDVFDLKPTLFGKGTFDEHTDKSQHLQGVAGSILAARRPAGNVFVEPFYFHTRMTRGTAGSSAGEDDRDTWGARLRGKQGPITIDWNGIRQTGHHLGREVDAWAASFIQNVLVTDGFGHPRIGGHIDLGSGGNTYNKAGPIHSFNQLYASPQYLGQGLLLSQSNIAILAPSLALQPARNVSVDLDYAFLRRLRQDDAVYGGLMRPYAGTERVPGHDVGTYARVVAQWALTRNILLDVEGERLFAGSALNRAGYGSGSYGTMSVTFLY
jgi:hypothetical protein